MGSATAASAPSAAPVLRIRLPPAWTPEEDARLERLARERGFLHWRRAWSRGDRQGSARDVYHRPFTARDDDDLARFHVRHGGRWREMSRAVHGHLPRHEAPLEGGPRQRRVPEQAVEAALAFQCSGSSGCHRDGGVVAAAATPSFFPQPFDSIPLAGTSIS
ncbi:transcription factor MYB73-like [Panicum hallii]|uniref:transcription factor MYB73-like n=1 Tax=Panicum hallii TaxID=206008 RepID=UPI000DF4CCB9|nr:transcription factor MYB73-like [Panicum hallii]